MNFRNSNTTFSSTIVLGLCLETYRVTKSQLVPVVPVPSRTHVGPTRLVFKRERAQQVKPAMKRSTGPMRSWGGPPLPAQTVGAQSSLRYDMQEMIASHLGKLRQMKSWHTGSESQDQTCRMEGTLPYS